MTRRPPRDAAGTSRCRVAGCSWWVTLPDVRDRDRAWSDHWASAHSNPSTLTTRCTVRRCGWTYTAADVAELRAHAADHRATHEGTSTP